MTDLPLELTLKTVSTKVTPASWERAQALKEKTGVRLSDIVSLCLLYMPEDLLLEKIAEQEKLLGQLPKAVRGVMRQADKLDAETRALLVKALSKPG